VQERLKIKAMKEKEYDRFDWSAWD